MGERCFCHLNGLEVKDATARKQFEEQKKQLEQLKVFVTPQMFGAKGDFVTDDTDALQEAIYTAQDLRCPVVLPRGEYSITSPLKMHPDKFPYFQLIGTSLRGVAIHNKHNGYAIDLNPEGRTFQDPIIENITFANSSGGTSYGIKANRMNTYQIKNCQFGGFEHGIYLDYCWLGDIYNCFFRDNDVETDGVMLCLGAQCNSVSVRNCRFNGNNRNSHLVKVAGGQSNVLFDTCAFEKGYGVLMNPSEGRLTNITFLNCYFEWMTGYCIDVQGGGDVNVYGVNISGCYFNGAEENSPEYAVQFGSMKGITVENCYSVRYTTAMIYNSNYFVKDYSIRNCIADGAQIARSPMHYEIVHNEAPTTGTWQKGTICWNFGVSGADTVGWICTQAGTPGTWVPF